MIAGINAQVQQFLSSNTQDFIEVITWSPRTIMTSTFLSSNTQDFIEVVNCNDRT